MKTTTEIQKVVIPDSLFIGVEELVSCGFCSRNTLFKIIKNDPTFPKGKKVGGTENSPLKWWIGDIVEWMRSEDV